MKELAHLLRVAAQAGGMEAAQRLAQAFGGRRIYIPRTAPDNHPLVLAGGRAAADAIMRAIGGERVDFPKRYLDPRRMVALSVLAEGGSANEAAARTGLSYRHVKRLRAEMRAGTTWPCLEPRRPKKDRDDRQLDLEDWLAGMTSATRVRNDRR